MHVTCHIIRFKRVKSTGHSRKGTQITSDSALLHSLVTRDITASMKLIRAVGEYQNDTNDNDRITPVTVTQLGVISHLYWRQLQITQTHY